MTPSDALGLLPPRHYTVGIDPASESFAAALLVGLGQAPRALETFENTLGGIEAFAAWLKTLGLAPDAVLVCVENTGVYSEALCYGLHGRGFLVALAAPQKVHRASDEGPKNDRRDSHKIAAYALRYRDRLVAWAPQEALTERVRTLLATREHLVRQKTATQNALGAMRRKVVKTPAAEAALEVVKATLKQQIEALTEELRRLIEDHPRVARMVALLVTAPGVGLLLAAQLLVLTNGFAERPSYRRLASHLGLCPHEHTSGKSVYRRPRSRGRGPSMMRKLLFLASGSVVVHEARFRQYYLRKVAEGKSKLLVRNNVANKLLRILCAMLREETPYMAEYRSVPPRLLKVTGSP